MDNTFTRAMGATERMRLWFPNINVVMAARITGPVSVQELEAAIEKARRKHPLLGARVELDEDRAGRFTTQGVPEIPMDVAPSAGEDAWLRRMEQELQHRWPIKTGPLARFVILHSTEASHLVINAHHSICDARSLAYLIRDILAFMSEPIDIDDIEATIPVALDEAIPSSASGGPLYRLLMRRMNKKWLEKGISFTESDYRDLHRAFWGKHEASIVSWALTEAQTQTLVSECRKRRVSVNSALYLAFLAAQYHVQGDTRDEFNNVLVPVDFRDYLTQSTGEALGLYASAIRLRFQYKPDQPFWRLAQVLDEKINRQLTDKNVFASQRTNVLHPSLLDGVAFALFGELDDKMARGLADRIKEKMQTGILVSNLGRLDLPLDYGDLHLEALIPPAIYAGNAEKALEVLTLGGRMHLTLTFDPSDIAGDTVRAVKDTAMQILAESAGW